LGRQRQCQLRCANAIFGEHNVDSSTQELNVVEGIACNYSCPTWKLPFRAMATKVLWTTSWVPMCSLPWMQHKRWIPIGLMGCVHMHRGIFTIEGWGSLSGIWNVVEKTREDNQKVKKTNWTISQTFTLKPKNDKIQAQLVSNILSKNMLKKVWWCKRPRWNF
jgi:hypothetical protein